MKKWMIGLVTMGLMLVAITGCSGGAPKDGTYEGIYEDEESGSGMTVTLTIADGAITECELVATDKTGAVKDEHYGEASGEANYQKAQRAVEGMKQYPDQLVALQNVDDIDAVSGATVSLKEFQIAVKDALKKAKQ